MRAAAQRSSGAGASALPRTRSSRRSPPRSTSTAGSTARTSRARSRTRGCSRGRASSASADREAIVGGLEAIRADIEAGRFEFRADREDIHLNIEAALAERIGEAAGRLHTARSRNDQVATDLRLFVRAACDEAMARLRSLRAALLEVADREAETVISGYTHLQRAQPVLLAHHLLAYEAMFARDTERFEQARARE